MKHAKKISLFFIGLLFIFSLPLTASARGHGGGYGGGHHGQNAGVNCWNGQRYAVGGQVNQNQQQTAQPQAEATSGNAQQEQPAEAVQSQQQLRLRDQSCVDPAQRENCPYYGTGCNYQNGNGGGAHHHNWRRAPGCRLSPAAS